MAARPISQLPGALDDWAGAISTDNEKLLSDLANAALRRSMHRTPVLTGNLRRSETTRVERDRAYLGSSAEYAQYVHDGTRFMPARPFFEEGIQDAIPEFVDIVRGWAEDTFDAKVVG
jgi:HK97 gp10 family phage protein